MVLTLGGRRADWIMEQYVCMVAVGLEICMTEPHSHQYLPLCGVGNSNAAIMNKWSIMASAISSLG